VRRTVLIAAGATAGLLALRTATKGRGPAVMETMMSRCWEMLPEEAPPVRMLHDLSTIREQNDRILRLLEQRMDSPS